MLKESSHSGDLGTPLHRRPLLGVVAGCAFFSREADSTGMQPVNHSLLL